MSKLNEQQQAVVDSTADRLLVLAGAGSGKALRNGTKVKTVEGDVPIEQLTEGDLVFGLDGNLYPVRGVYPQGKLDVYRITFSDGNFIDCNKDHIWIYQTQSMRNDGRDTNLTSGTLEEMMKIPLKVTSTRLAYNNLWIPMCKPCQYSKKELPIDPYLLGLLIGDGCISENAQGIQFSNVESDILDKLSELVAEWDCKVVPHKHGIDCSISKCSGKSNRLNDKLNELKLRHKSIHKELPDMYLRSSIDDRLSLLKGLIDTDGYVEGSSYCYYTSSSRLALQVMELAESLGFNVKLTTRKNPHYGKDEKKVYSKNTSYELRIKTSRDIPNIHSSAKHSEKRKKSRNQNFARRHVISIEKLEGQQAEMTCISVASPDHSFLTEHYIPTHNTHTMLERINKLVVDGVSPTDILVLTFTNAAAFEMRDRYKRSHTNKIIPEFRTFHSFCYHLLIVDKSIREHLGYSQPPTVGDAGMLKRIETEAKMQCNIKLPQAKLSGEVPCSTPSEKQEYELYKKCINKLMKQKNVITFDILATEVSELFTENSDLTTKYKQRYKYIFVDEFQDTDMQQVKFISSFNHSKFCVVGDCLQNLYSFRGCTNEVIKSLSKSPDWEKIRLFENYRSTTQICDFANKMSTYADKEYRIEMHAQRGGDKVEVIPGAYAGWEAPVDTVHTKILLDRLLDKKTDKDVAVLCRTNKEVKYICDRLNAAGILYSSGKRNEDALNILKSVHDNEYMLDWLSSFLTAEKYAEYIRLASQVENPDISWFAKEYGSVPGIKERGQAIVEIRKILRSSKATVSKVADIFKTLGIKSGELTSVETDEDILPTIIETIESQGDQDIYVGTIHSSKGLEYDTVYVMGVNDRSFQLKDEDMLNLYYVAITRAKNHLVVFRA